MTNQEWLDGLTLVQLRIVAECWAIPRRDIPFSLGSEMETLKSELAKLENLQDTPTRRVEIFTDHFLKYWNPSLMKRLPNSQLTETCVNELCNDLVTIDAEIEDNQFKVLEFFATGCCTSQCSAAMLIEYFRNKTVDEVLTFTDKDMLELVGIAVMKPRQGCVLLGLECLRKICA